MFDRKWLATKNTIDNNRLWRPSVTRTSLSLLRKVKNSSSTQKTQSNCTIILFEFKPVIKTINPATTELQKPLGTQRSNESPICRFLIQRCFSFDITFHALATFSFRRCIRTPQLIVDSSSLRRRLHSFWSSLTYCLGFLRIKGHYTDVSEASEGTHRMKHTPAATDVSNAEADPHSGEKLRNCLFLEARHTLIHSFDVDIWISVETCQKRWTRRRPSRITARPGRKAARASTPTRTRRSRGPTGSTSTPTRTPSVTTTSWPSRTTTSSSKERTGTFSTSATRTTSSARRRASWCWAGSTASRGTGGCRMRSTQSNPGK